MKVLNLLADSGYGGIQQVSKIIDKAFRNNGWHSQTKTLQDFASVKATSFLFRWIAVIRGLRNFVKDSRHDLIITHNPIAALILCPPKFTKLTYVIHGPLFHPGSRFNQRYFYRLLHIISGMRSDSIVVVSAAISNDLPNFLKKKVYVINNSPSVEFYNNSPDSRLGYLTFYGGLRLIQFGRFSYQKNQKYSLLVLKSLLSQGKKAQLVLYGSGADENEIISYAERLNLKVCRSVAQPSGGFDLVILPPITGLSWISERFDLAIFPSRYEGFPLAIVECLSINLPVLSADCKYGPCEIYEKYKNYVQAGLATDGCMYLLPKDVDSDQSINVWIDAILEVENKRTEQKISGFFHKNLAFDMSQSWVDLASDMAIHSVDSK